MLRKDNSHDGGIMEGFFGILKREIFYGFEKSLKISMNWKMQLEPTLSFTIRKESKLS